MIFHCLAIREPTSLLPSHGWIKGGNSPPQRAKVGDLSTMLRLSALRVEKVRTFFLAQNAVFCCGKTHLYMAIEGGAWGFCVGLFFGGFLLVVHLRLNPKLLGFCY